MLNMDKIPEEERVEHLFLLVGTNPLPNYVAACLLAAPNGVIHLLHSSDTGTIAQRLNFAIRRREPSLLIRDIHLYQIDNADGAEIRAKLNAILNNLKRSGLLSPASSVGLNYTGGTKAMSLHAYHALEAAWPDTRFSYLDARTLSMHFDGHKGNPSRSVFVGLACKIKLNELTRLHDINNTSSRVDESEAGNARRKLTYALLPIRTDSIALAQWTQWRPNLAEDDPRLPDEQNEPALKPLIQAIHEICSGEGTADSLAQALGKFPALKSYSKWFDGEWLEEYVLGEVHSLKKELHIHDLAHSLKEVKKREFEVDVAAMRGYQLFAVSCKASDRKETCKEHLLEVYVRARQLGGDEAKVALVCFYTDPRKLEREIAESWFTEGKIRVFGPEHLPQLSDHLRHWFETANL